MWSTTCSRLCLSTIYNLPALRKAIQHDLPPAPHGLWATWREIMSIHKKQRENPDYVFVPELPKAA